MPGLLPWTFAWTLTKYSIFRTKIGVFKQEQGLTIGGSLSLIIPDLLTEISRFSSVFLNGDLYSKNYKSEKNRIYEVSPKVAPCILKAFDLKIQKLRKVYRHEKKIVRVQICRNAPTPSRWSTT